MSDSFMKSFETGCCFSHLVCFFVNPLGVTREPCCVVDAFAFHSGFVMFGAMSGIMSMESARVISIWQEAGREPIMAYINGKLHIALSAKFAVNMKKAFLCLFNLDVLIYSS
ncbi:hypothetical protein F2Q68_00033851 [Brassica cretica]|uniref:Uncharacterized protein n=1 Tax=Brassica cretica TaxID=69181 RepID=A0A8S9HBF8_BRACR|nr:hypothetical protein F2Q68_00033851 [Brassica cretica]